jgi:hypothetical protein
MPINGLKVSEEVFGVDATNPKLKKGDIRIVGHTVRDGSPIPERGNAGTSPNVKTGFPVNEGKK